MTKPNQDPIVEEIHRIREELLQEHGGSFEALMEHLRSRQTEGGRQVLSAPSPCGLETEPEAAFSDRGIHQTLVGFRMVA